MKAPLRSGVSSNRTLLVLARRPCTGFPLTRNPEKSRAASHRTRTLLQDASVATSALQAARACEVSPNHQNAVKVPRAFTLQIHSINLRFSGPRNTTCCGDEGLLCSSSERSLPSSIACCLWEKAPQQAWLWPILYRNIGHMVACELLGDSGGNGKPTHVKLVRPLSCLSSVTVFATLFSKVLCG